MAFANRPIHDLKDTDIEDLLEAKEPEGKNIEYKLSFSLSTTDEKREFLADISSFANTAGGYIIFGVKEEKGVPVELPGVAIENADSEKLKIENIIRDGITPRIQGVSMQPVNLKNGYFAFVIYVPRSYSAPHMVSYQGASRFYARNSAGKYPLDVHQLRQAFLLSETVSEKIRDFRLGRVAQITADETPVILYGKQRIIAHIIPLASFATYQNIDMRNIREDAQKKFNPSYYFHRHNIDGHVSCNSSTKGNAGSYYQIFRAGQIEHVKSDLTRVSDGTSYFPSLVLKQDLITACDEALRLQKHYGIEQPIFVFFSLTNVKGVRLAVNPRLNEDTPAFDRDIILTREVMLENYPADEKQLRLLMKPALDEIWNAAGYAECHYSREDLQ